MFREMFEMLGKKINLHETTDSWQSKYIWSMAQLGSLKDLPRNQSLPYLREASKHEYGRVDFPQELFDLLLVARDWDVWFNGDVPQGKAAFRLKVTGVYHNLISGVEFLYGVNSNISALKFQSAFDFGVNVPVGFSVKQLIELLRADEKTLIDFVLKYGVLNKVQREFIQKKGLDGLRR